MSQHINIPIILINFLTNHKHKHLSQLSIDELKKSRLASPLLQTLEEKMVLTSANLASDPLCDVNTNPITLTRTLVKFAVRYLVVESGFDSD